MDEAVQAHLAALEAEVRTAALSEGGKHTALWCLGQLLPRYAQYRQTRESRYGEEIARLVRGAPEGDNRRSQRRPVRAAPGDAHPGPPPDSPRAAGPAGTGPPRAQAIVTSFTEGGLSE
jgi:hypothetical protein